MDRQHRRDLRHDKFVDEVGVLTSKARQNQGVLIIVAAVTLLIAVAVYGIFFYRGNQERKAQAALSTAIETIESPLIVEGSQPNPRARFKTEVERNAAAEKQFKDVASQFSGTDASAIANLYLARLSAARGDMATAKKLLQEFVNEDPADLLVGSARYSLYQMRIDAGEGAQVATELTAELAKPEAEMVLPGDSLLVLLAHAYDAQGNEQKTRDTYKRIVTEFPDSPFALEAQRRVGTT
jgi:TolA-binding protein